MDIYRYMTNLLLLDKWTKEKREREREREREQERARDRESELDINRSEELLRAG